MDDMIIDVDYALEVYQQKNEGVKKVSKNAFLKKLGMSLQTANNYQNSLSSLKALQYAQKIKDLTGLSLDEIVKPKKD